MRVGGVDLQARQELNPQPFVLETNALPIELLAYIPMSRVSRRWQGGKTRDNGHLLGFPVQCMFSAAGAVLIKFNTIRIVAAILFRHVIAFLAVIARQDDHRANVLLF